MRSLVSSAVLVLFYSTQSFSAQAADLFCNIVDRPNTSELRISYDDTNPLSVALRSPEEDDFRDLNFLVESVVERNDVGQESFTAKPVLNFEIDWSKEPNCFLEIGTQWYFNFDHQKQNYFVQLLPFFVKESQTCIPPRAQVQSKRLSCSF